MNEEESLAPTTPLRRKKGAVAEEIVAQEVKIATTEAKASNKKKASILTAKSEL